MKKQLILLTFVAFIANALYAQDVGRETYVIDELEDTTDVTTIKDIIKKQQKVFSNVSNTEHITDVWKRKSFFNISFVNETLKPDDVVPITDFNSNDGKSYLNDGYAGEYKSDWGVSLQVGHNYRISKPIADMVSFNIDWNIFDLGWFHFSAEKSINSKKIVDNNEYTNQPIKYYTPFNAEKHDFNLSSSPGISLDIAPFAHSNSSFLSFIKINAYLHIGYGTSLLLMKSNKEDGNNKIDNTALDWGHGILTSFGASISILKSIGIGFERRKSNYKYTSLDSDNYGDNKWDFNSISSRFYLQIRY